METINSTFHSSQSSGAGPSSQVKRGGTLGSQANFEAPSHLLAYDGTTDPTEHILKFENAALLHRKSTISLFGINLEEKETLRAYVQCFNTVILEVPTAHHEVLVSALTQGLCEGLLFKSLHKKPAADFLDVLARAEKYINLENTWLVKKNGRDKRKESELSSTRRLRGEPRGCLHPHDPKNDHYTPSHNQPC
ncbi:hypothetical protein Sango_1578500 [Sesamum angolense]|uniref:Uncharacterized protein n=1 Tax=Sesamum angolense TaxID=2727404 RepID=A0AAE1WQ25_9LAMI|nr:hypothetical protein Sango_1578500 [Sesamum angolense]